MLSSTRKMASCTFYLAAIAVWIGVRMGATAEYGIKCPDNLSPLPGTNNQPKPCENDAACGVDTHYCLPNSLQGQPGLCCRYCPCGGPPLTGEDNQPLECDTDECCSDTNHFCNKINIPGKTNVCCPRAPDGATTTAPPSPGPQPETNTSTGQPQPEPEPEPGSTTTSGPAGALTWQSMFSEHKNQNPSFAIPDAASFRPNLGAAVPTSGQFKPCERNADCYTHREPKEWCNSMPEYNWVGEGCACVKDAQKPSCIITREKVSNKQKEWTFCQTEATFTCP